MHRLSDIVGKPIVSGENGKKLGQVSDLLLDDSKGRLVGVVVSNGWLHKEQVLPFPDVQTFGGDAVITRSGGEPIGRREWRDAGMTVARSSTLKGKSIVTTGGQRIGAIKDVMIDEQTGGVDALEVSGNGMLSRRALLPVTSDIRMGRDVVVVPDTAAEQLRSPQHARGEK